MRLWLASTGLDGDRAWDERYSIDNLTALLDGERWPANGLYPTLSYLPQAALVGSLDGVCALAPGAGPAAVCRLRDGKLLTPAGYWWSRLLSVVFGTLSIYWLVRIGRYSFGPRVGLAAASLLAMVPWHVRQSSVFKPDVLMLLFFLIACETTLRVAASPTLRRHLGVGAAVGLAAAAKYNGAAAAVPLVVTTLLAVRTAPLRLARLLAAGAAAVVVFTLVDLPLLLQPWLLFDFGQTLRDYERKAAAVGGSAATVPTSMLGHLVSDRYHGWPIALLAAIGLLAFGWLAVHAGRRRREELVVLLAFPFGYVALYTAVTAHPAEHNWLPVAPFTSLAAACALALAGRALARARPAAARLAPAALATLLTLSAAVAGRYVYSEAVPTTWERAARRVTAALPQELSDRLVVFDEQLGGWPRLRRQPRNRAAVLASGGLGDDRERVERGADAVLSGVAQDRFAYVPPWRRGETIQPTLFRSQGPKLRVALHPWRCAAAPLALAANGGAFVVPDPRPAAGWVSFRLLTAPGVEPPGPIAARFAGRDLRLVWGGRERDGHRFLSERVELPERGGPWQLRVVGLASRSLASAERLAWRPPEAPGPVGCPPSG